MPIIAAPHSRTAAVIGQPAVSEVQISRVCPLHPANPAGLFFSEGGDAIKLHTEGSLTIPRTGIKRVRAPEGVRKLITRR